MMVKQLTSFEDSALMPLPEGEPAPCPHCGSLDIVARMGLERFWRCYGCGEVHVEVNDACGLAVTP